MPDPSTPNPSENDPSPSETEKGTPARKLRLKRIIVEDLEINPHLNPDREPTPEAQPYEEPEEPLIPHQPSPMVPKDLTLPPFPIQQELPPSKPEEPEPSQAELEAETPAHPSENIPSKAKASTGGSPFRKALLLVTLLLLLGLAGVFFWTKVINTTAPTPAIAAEQAPSVTTPPAPASPLSVAAVPLADWQVEETSLSIQTYMEGLQALEIAASEDPSGIFIGRIFIPEGSLLHPELGLALETVVFSSPQPIARFSGPDGRSYSLKAGLIK